MGKTEAFIRREFRFDLNVVGNGTASYNVAMANGTPGDHPVTDLVHYGKHPFPPDIEELVRRLYDLDPNVFNLLEHGPMDWQAGRHLQAARTLLRGLVETHGDPIARRRFISEYTAEGIG